MNARQANRLVNETSPYLLQHAWNPVQWWPWGEEARAEARRRDVPILLSVGYSACHWCHVMERESFEDAEIARLMNDSFVCVKVDREERPDVDQVYMTAVQVMTGHGGWPLTAFLTPEGEPFFGGTYFPPVPRHGMPSFPSVLRRVAEVWRADRLGLVQQSGQLLQAVRRVEAPVPGDGEPDTSLLKAAAEALARNVDTAHGGFGHQPKFPHAVELEVLLRASCIQDDEGLLRLFRLSLDGMRRGGIHDHLGGGFHRYAVDEEWRIPHFEKMLYDNALLVRAYTLGWQATGEAELARVVEGTVSYVLREMTHPQGGFFSSQDADSEGEEGRFFAWTPREIRAALGDPEAASLFEEAFGVTSEGNFEGRNVLYAARDAASLAEARRLAPEAVRASLERSRAALFAVRERRPRPMRDEKVICAWNGLMVSSLARAGFVFDRPDWVTGAARAARFLWSELRDPGGRLSRTWRDGRRGPAGCLDDHAFLMAGLVDLYEADGDPGWLGWALSVAEGLDARFGDGEGGWFLTAGDGEPLVERPRAHQDHSVPSATAGAAGALLRLGALTGEPRRVDRAAAACRRHLGEMQRQPFASASLILVADRLVRGPREVVVAGDPAAGDTRALLGAVRRSSMGDAVLARRFPGEDLSAHPARALLDGKEPRGGAAAYVCERSTCSPPITDPAALAARLASPAR